MNRRQSTAVFAKQNFLEIIPNSKTIIIPASVMIMTKASFQTGLFLQYVKLER
jgi:hypothetical protein